uniref:CUB domain-containing protein n=1 Tax=Daphnia magna TaxID=35525 RepID=A0A0P6EKV9_9CRUS
MAFKIAIFFTLAAFMNVGQGCETNQVDQLTARQGLDELLKEESYSSANNLWTTPYYYNYQPRTPLPGFANAYEGRTPMNRQQPNYFIKDEDSLPESRLFLGNIATNLIGSSLFNNRFSPANQFRPFANLLNRIPPNTANSRSAFDACTSPAGEAGICTMSSVCSLFAGRPSGSCSLSRVCCVNVVNGCGKTVTLNNTYWQSPAAVSSPSNCALTIKLDAKLTEQSFKPICQIRLDMVSFTTAPPVAGTCADTFQVGGATTMAPTICGVNSGQHMYLDVPSSGVTPSDVQLMFNFAAGAATRSWNIKVAMLPCGADYLAPPGCLQYFTSATGRVSSFNWQDTAGAHQLNNQNYQICFRTELVSSQPANRACFSLCPVPNGGDAFSITTPASILVDESDDDAVTTTTGASASSNVGTTVSNTAGDTLVATCLYDFLLIAGARGANGVESDRYCGNELNPAVGTPPEPGADTSVQICSKLSSYFTYHDHFIFFKLKI